MDSIYTYEGENPNMTIRIKNFDKRFKLKIFTIDYLVSWMLPDYSLNIVLKNALELVRALVFHPIKRIALETLLGPHLVSIFQMWNALNTRQLRHD